MNKEIEIPEGYEARIEGNKVILEPKESEDERIRKDIVALIKFTLEDGSVVSPDSHTTKEEALAYLERQKEQKPILIPKFKAGDRIYDKRDSYNRNVIREVGKDYYINTFAQKMDMAYTDANFEFLEHLDNDLVDNKPAEWSEEDEKMMRYVIGSIDTNISDSNFENIRIWLESVKNRVQSKPQTVYKTAIESILEICNSCDLKSNFSAIAMDFWASVKVKCEDALQTHQSFNEPHWKPSEEQVRTLFETVRAYEMCGFTTRSSILKQLYDDLQKLF